MNLRTLKKEFGPDVEVSRDRKGKVVEVQAAGLGYRATEKEFSSEAELAAYLRSKIPVNGKEQR